MKLANSLQYLLDNAKPKSLGLCATYMRQAFEAGFGVKIERTLHAKDYGPSYEKLGFKKVFSFPEEKKENYKEEIGDICIVHYEPHGHICAKTTKGWCSDFKQIDRYGGSIRKKNPPFDIYRII